MDNVTHLPTKEKKELLIGPFVDTWRVVLDGRQIPLLSGYKQSDGKIFLVLDGRFGGVFSEEDAWQAAHLVANALAIGQGYPSYTADTKDQPFAPRVSEIGPPPAPQSEA